MAQRWSTQVESDSGFQGKGMKKSTAKIRPPHMSYGTYANLKSFIELKKNQAHQQYVDAIYLLGDQRFVPGEDDTVVLVKEASGDRLAKETLWKNYSHWVRYYNRMTKELRYAAHMGSCDTVKKAKFFYDEDEL